MNIKLDQEQIDAINDIDHNLLVIAAAGSGKSLTILAKVNYLINKCNYDEKDILCISFTNEATISLKNKLLNNYNINIDVKTFHKLALDIIKQNKIVDIALEDYLDIVIDEFLNSSIYNNHLLITYILKYTNISFNKYNYLKKYNIFLNSTSFIKLKKTIKTFIKLFKCNNYNLDQLKNMIRCCFNKKRRQILLVIFAIYIYYDNKLIINNVIDFDDMLSLAINMVKNSKLDYKYIIVDEYQDTSYVRYQLLKEIVNHAKAKLMVVGDDWQSIYHFSGCSLDVFLNFDSLFNNTKKIYLTHTYRNPQELTDVAAKFIMKNKYQIKKKLISTKKLSKPIKLIYYKDKKQDFTKLIIKLAKEGSLLILGRNNFDINDYLDLKVFNIDYKGIIRTSISKNYDIRFLTIHKAKGLESDNVIIINLENDAYGLPNKLIDDKVLEYVTCNSERYLYAEERRLFYVALTRSKNRVYLYTNKYNKSIFVKEIRFNRNVNIVKLM